MESLVVNKSVLFLELFQGISGYHIKACTL